MERIHLKRLLILFNGPVVLAQGKPAEAEADFTRCRSLGGMPKPEAESLLREMKGRRAPE